jgi:hypothetical protein
VSRLGPWAARLLADTPRQPDQRSCGAAVLVVERALRDEGYAQLVVDGRHPTTGHTLPGTAADRFRAEVLAMHRRTTGPVTAAGRLQMPWPRALGTPPWAVAGQLSTAGDTWVVRWARWPASRSTLLRWITAAVSHGRPAPLYVGSGWLPRHVVLAVGTDGDRLSCYEPSGGRLRPAGHEAFLEAALDLAGWSTPWCAVLPDDAQVP